MESGLMSPGFYQEATHRVSARSIFGYPNNLFDNSEMRLGEIRKIRYK
jgi:hypothetical protein